MVKTLEAAAAFDGGHVCGLFDHTDQRRVATRMRTDRAGRSIRKRETRIADDRVPLKSGDCFGEFEGEIVGRAQKEIGEPGGRLFTDAR